MSPNGRAQIDGRKRLRLLSPYTNYFCCCDIAQRYWQPRATRAGLNC